MSKVKILKSFRYNGEKLTVGQVVDLPGKQERAYLSLHMCEKYIESKEQEKATPKPKVQSLKKVLKDVE